MNRVEVGQVWSFIDARSSRIEAEVVGVCRGKVKMRAGSRTFHLSLSVLVRGRRGATLVRKPDGTTIRDQAILREMRTLSDRGEVQESASAMVRTVAPRGIQKAVDKYAQALAMSRTGMQHAEIALHFGTNKFSISSWIAKARAAEQDARFKKGA